MTNLVPRQYREVSVATVDFPLSLDSLQRHFLGREVYKRTRFVVVRRGGDTALIRVDAAPSDQVMTVVVGVAVLALPAECAFVAAADVDTGVPSALAAAARRAAPWARGVAVEGRYHHINFILDPSAARVRVVDVVPPGPPKLVDQARRVLAVAEDLPPIELVPAVVDLADLARTRVASRYLLPCRGSGFVADGAEVVFLDERPPRQDWLLIGCARSRELHRSFYQDVPDTVDMCPRGLASRADGAPAVTAQVTLTKCCLLEEGVDDGGDTIVVPWGASLRQVGQGLLAAARRAGAALESPLSREPTWSPG